MKLAFLSPNASLLRKTGCLAALVLLAGPGLGQAATVLDFDGSTNNYGNSASHAFLLPPVVQPAGTNDYVYVYSATTGISPTSNYTGPKFYGGGWMTTTSGAAVAGFATSRVRYNFTNVAGSTWTTQIEWGMPSHSGSTTTGASFVAFDKAEFTGGAGEYSLDSTSALNMTISTGSQSSVRFAILSGGQWYLSAASVAPNSNAGGSLSLAGDALLSSLWAAWDPTGGSNGRLGDAPSAFTVAASSLGDIDAVGYYTSYNNSASNQYADIGNFSADLTAVPEPSSLALGLLGAVSAGVVMMRRRKLSLTRSHS